MQQETTKKDLVKKPNNSSSISTTSASGDLFDAEVVDTQDILIPKLLLMHGTSQYVGDGKAAVGDLVKSTDGFVLAKKESKVRVIIFEKWRTWQEFDNSPVPRLTNEYPWTRANDELPWEFKSADQIPMKRKKTHNFYGLVVTNDEVSKIPIKISFASTNLKHGRVIASNYEEDLATFQEQRAKAVKNPQLPICRTYLIGSATQISAKTQKPFGVFTLTDGAKPSEAIMAEALKWKAIVKAAKANNTLKEDDTVDSDVEETVATSQF